MSDLRCATCGRFKCADKSHAGVARSNCEHPTVVFFGEDREAKYFKCLNPRCKALIREDRD